MKKTSKNFNLYLMKESVTSFEECLDKKNYQIENEFTLDHSIGIQGSVYLCKTNESKPKWINYIEQLTNSEIDEIKNSSNKAVLIGNLEKRYFAITFGFGKALLNDSNIERNFGIKCVVNTVNQNKLKSLNSHTIEDLVITTQRQSNLSASTSEFDLNTDTDILTAISGVPNQENIADFYTGKDSLTFKKKIEINELKDIISYFILKSKEDTYKTKGFAWIDNINHVNDKSLITKLNEKFCNTIVDKEWSSISFSPKDLIDWENTGGFLFQGMNKKTTDESNYELDINIENYLNHIQSMDNLLEILKRHKVLRWNSSSSSPVSLGNAFSNICAQIELDNNKFILNAGAWFEVNSKFYDIIKNFVDNIPLNTSSLLESFKNEKEGEYNKRICDSDSGLYYLFDTKLESVVGARKKSIEICDIFEKSGKFIHVKRKTRSSQLSHLFSQGKISAQCIAADKKLYNTIAKKVNKHFSEEVLGKFNANKLEVIFAIVTNKSGCLSEILPFFSMLNLMSTCNELDRMSFQYSVTLVNELAN